MKTINMSRLIYQLGKKPFTFQEFIKKTKYKKSYGRNLLHKLSKSQIIETLPSEKDKRTRLYKLNWKKITQLIILGGEEKQSIIDGLKLTDYSSEYVALRDFEVIDHDFDLLLLARRVFKNGDVPGIVLTNIDEPRQVILHESGY